MNFDEIENLTINEINELYDDIIEYNGNNLLAGTRAIWEVQCDNGNFGYFHSITSDSNMTVGTYFKQCGTQEHYSVFNICGSGRCGYGKLVAHFDEDTIPSVWELNCDNGISGYFVAIHDDSRVRVGKYFYECGGTNPTLGAYNVCGEGECGYTRLISH